MTNSIITKLYSKQLVTILSLGLLLLSDVSYSQPSTAKSPEEKYWIRKGDGQWKKAHIARALDFYKKAVSVNPHNSYTNFQVGAIYFVTDSFKIRALPYFQNTIKYSPPGIDDTIVDAYYYMAYCYMLRERYDSAAMCFRQYEGHLDNVRMNKEAFREVNTNLGVCKMAPAILKRDPDSTAWLISGKKQPTFVKVAQKEINTQFPEYSEIVYGNDSSMLFTSRRPSSQKGKLDDITGRYFEDTYISKKDSNGYWSPPSLFAKQLNIPPKKLNMATVSLSDDGNTLLIYRNGDILQSDKTNGQWSNPRNLSKDIKKLKKYYVPSAFISQDGSRLLLVSDAKGGYGNRDIYMCTRDANGSWSDPKNLGPVINTSDDEDAPYLMPDNKTLFFSSKGHGGLGGYDIFVSHMDSNGNWSAPQNLGAPINSPADDIYFIYKNEEQKGYFSSSRISGMGDMDIYSFAFTCDDIDNTFLKGKVTADSKDGTMPSVSIALTDLSSRRKSAPITVAVNESGYYSGKLKPNHNYHLDISGEGYLPYSINFSTPHQCNAFNLYQTIRLSKFSDSAGAHAGQNLLVKNAFYRSVAGTGYKNAKGDMDLGLLMVSNNDTGTAYEKDTNLTIAYTPVQRDSLLHKTFIATSAGLNKTNTAKANNVQPLPSSGNVIYFHFKKYKIDAENYPILDAVAANMKANKDMKVKIMGYTDNSGKTFFNKRLSILRASAVAKYLYRKGIRHSRISYKGYGATHFAAPNDREHNHLNRRVEIEIVK